MESSLLPLVLAGVLAGTLHVLAGPDHLAAIAPFTVNRSLKSWKIGLWWGLGHTGSIWVIGLLAFLLKGFLPLSGLSHWSEKLVGIVLIGLGVWGIQKAFGLRVHCHVHQHNGRPHVHIHVHNKKTAHPANGLAPHHHAHAPMGIGVVHGFAGSAHLMAILPALALPGKYNAAGYVAGFGVGTILAMMGFSWLMGWFLQKIIGRFAKGFQWVQLGFSFLAIGVGIVWLLYN